VRDSVRERERVMRRRWGGRRRRGGLFRAFLSDLCAAERQLKDIGVRG
jgi:hypothetical protein